MLKIPSRLRINYSKKTKKLIITGPFGCIHLKWISSEPLLIKKDFLCNEIFSKPEAYAFMSNVFRDVLQGSYAHLELHGIGNQVFLDKEKKQIRFRLGFSHLCEVKLPSSFIWFRVQKKDLRIWCLNNNFLYSFCLKLLKLKPWNDYKANGVYFKGQKIKLKTSKKKLN